MKSQRIYKIYKILSILKYFGRWSLFFPWLLVIRHSFLHVNLLCYSLKPGIYSVHIEWPSSAVGTDRERGVTLLAQVFPRESWFHSLFRNCDFLTVKLRIIPPHLFTLSALLLLRFEWGDTCVWWLHNFIKHYRDLIFVLIYSQSVLRQELRPVFLYVLKSLHKVWYLVSMGSKCWLHHWIKQRKIPFFPWVWCITEVTINSKHSHFINCIVY